MSLAQLELRYNTNGAVTSTNLYYLHSDHLNTPRLATNQAQTLLWKWDSDAFGLGNPTGDVDGDGVVVDIPLRFPGQIFEAYSNLNYNYFRDYEANTGRYVQSDPIGLEGGLNTYGYVEANPVRYIDSRGLVKAIYFSPEDETSYNGALTDPDDPTKCMIYGHGTPQSIQDDRASTRSWFGNTPEGLENLKTDLKKQGCTEDMPVVFKSCSTGQGENSIAESFSPVWGNRTRAPDTLVWWYWKQDSTFGFSGKKKYWIDPVPYASDISGKHADLSKPGSYRDFGGD